ncbi:hypothetical protein QQS21_002711 [Conoideocrella luteorostrata]|uniref:Uncharacterized protein n=1 Tax=Conoideocrella luteorostrata TaxID=1105319 RepID=A0AAJ0CUK7_9HYPO|nr:hypothetical protein QQS21_002711 [Conoideocrella luteorostrata]
MNTAGLGLSMCWYAYFIISLHQLLNHSPPTVTDSFPFISSNRFTAGAGAYYFAKREINADRQAKLEAACSKKQAIRSMEYAGIETASSQATNDNGAPARTDTAGSPSQEASHDPAATRHAAVTESQQTREKSKYESSAPYRSRKGDRFS